MDYNLLWSKEEYQSLLDYKWNSFKYINMFLNPNITNRERKFNPNTKNYPKTSEEFKKAIETIIKLYEAIEKNYILNDSKLYTQKLFRGVRKNSNNPYFASTSEDIDVALSFINGINNGNTSNDILIEIVPSQVPWIDLETFIPESKGGDLNEKEILFSPCEYQTMQEVNFKDYLKTTGMINNLSRDTKMRLNRLNDLCLRKVELLPINYENSNLVSLDSLAAKFDQYRQNLIKFSEMTKSGCDTKEIEKEIVNFKSQCSSFLKSQFNKLDLEIKNKNNQNLDNWQIKIDENSIMREVYIGNTGRMFSISNKDEIEQYYFKPAESKDGTIKSYRAYIQEAAYNIQKIVNPVRSIKCKTCKINGTFGAIQEKIDIDKEATRQFYNCFSKNGSELSLKLLNQILDEYLVDYCLCNYDAHAKNFVIDKNGNLRGIDKEQSFRYIHNDVKDDMMFSQNYNETYGEKETIYATIFKKMASGDISYKALDELNYRAARLAQVPDIKYREIFRNYAYSKTKSEKEAEILLDRIVSRKQSIVKKVDMLKETIYEKAKYQVKESEKNMYIDNINLVQNKMDYNSKLKNKKPYIKQEVINVVTYKFFERQKQISFVNNTKEELLKQKENLLRQKAMAKRAYINAKERKQVEAQQQLENEEDMDHGMSM